MKWCTFPFYFIETVEEQNRLGISRSLNDVSKLSWLRSQYIVEKRSFRLGTFRFECSWFVSDLLFEENNRSSDKGHPNFPQPNT